MDEAASWDDLNPREDPRLGTDVFISYSREDRKFVGRLHGALKNHGQKAWVDWEGIPASAKWRAEVRQAIDQADAFCFVISPDSVESTVCREEAAHAAASNKRIVPLLCRQVPQRLIPESVAVHNWIDFTDQASFDEALAALVRTISTEPEWVSTHTKLLVRAREWHQAGRDGARLLRGSDLREAESWLEAAEGKDPLPTALHTTFLASSRKAATRRRRTLIGGFAAAIALSLVLSALALIQRNTAQRNEQIAEEQRGRAAEQAAVANSQELASRALSSLDQDLALGTLLAIEAARVAPTEAALHAIHVAAQTAVWTERVLRVEGGRVFSVAFSPDGSTLASGGADGRVALWDVRTGRQAGVLETGSESVSGVVFSPDGASVATGTVAGAVSVWDASTGDLSESMSAGSEVTAIAFSPDGSVVSAGTEAGQVPTWSLARGSPVFEPKDLGIGSIEAMVFDPSGSRLSVGGASGSVVTLNPRLGAILEGPSRKVGSVTSMAISPDQALIAIGTLTGEIHVRKSADGKQINEPLSLGGVVGAVAFSPDGTAVASATVDATVQIWDLRTGEALGGHLAGQEGESTNLAFSPDGSLLASAGGGKTGSVAIWRSPGLRSPGLTASAPPSQVGGSPGELVDVAFGADDSLVAAADGELKVFDRTSGDLVVGVPSRDSARTWRVDFSPDAQTLASGNSDGSVTLWDPVKGTPIGGPLRDSLAVLVDVAYHPRGEFLAAVSNGGAIVLWNPRTGKLVGDPVSPDPIGEPLPGHEALYDVEFSPDGGMIGTGSPDGTVRLWDVPDRAPVGSPFMLPGAHNESWKVAFSPDGGLIASGNSDGSISVWNVRTGEPVAEPLQGHTAAIPSLEFSPDGSTLASGSLDGTLVLWDTTGWEQIGEPLQAFGAGWGMAFSADGSTLASTGSAGIYLRGETAWTSDLELLEERLCQVAGRNLTKAEWERFMASRPHARTCPQFPLA
jgi:WD40 repeat protein